MTTAAQDAADWRLRAACRGHDTNLWFIDKGHYHAAQPICDSCPVRAECLHYALKTEPNDHRYGLWGGLTGRQRRKLPALPPSKDDAITALREHLATNHPPAERTKPPMTTAPAHPAADVQPKAAAEAHPTTPPAPDAEKIPVGKLLKWGDDHDDPEIQDQAARAHILLTSLRRRHAADAELAAITTERQQLEARLAELTTRESELAPPKPKGRRASPSYDAATVRTWAQHTGVDCPNRGRIPKHVLDAWRTATGSTTDTTR